MRFYLVVSCWLLVISCGAFAQQINPTTQIKPGSTTRAQIWVTDTVVGSPTRGKLIPLNLSDEVHRLTYSRIATASQPEISAKTTLAQASPATKADSFFQYKGSMVIYSGGKYVFQSGDTTRATAPPFTSTYYDISNMTYTKSGSNIRYKKDKYRNSWKPDGYYKLSAFPKTTANTGTEEAETWEGVTFEVDSNAYYYRNDTIYPLNNIINDIIAPTNYSASGSSAAVVYPSGTQWYNTLTRKLKVYSTRLGWIDDDAGNIDITSLSSSTRDSIIRGKEVTWATNKTTMIKAKLDSLVNGSPFVWTDNNAIGTKLSSTKIKIKSIDLSALPTQFETVGTSYAAEYESVRVTTGDSLIYEKSNNNPTKFSLRPGQKITSTSNLPSLSDASLDLIGNTVILTTDSSVIQARMKNGAVKTWFRVSPIYRTTIPAATEGGVDNTETSFIPPNVPDAFYYNSTSQKWEGHFFDIEDNAPAANLLNTNTSATQPYTDGYMVIPVGSKYAIKKDNVGFISYKAFKATGLSDKTALQTAIKTGAIGKRDKFTAPRYRYNVVVIDSACEITDTVYMYPNVPVAGYHTGGDETDLSSNFHNGSSTIKLNLNSSSKVAFVNYQVSAYAYNQGTGFINLSIEATSPALAAYDMRGSFNTVMSNVFIKGRPYGGVTTYLDYGWIGKYLIASDIKNVNVNYANIAGAKIDSIPGSTSTTTTLTNTAYRNCPIGLLVEPNAINSLKLQGWTWFEGIAPSTGIALKVKTGNYVWLDGAYMELSTPLYGIDLGTNSETPSIGQRGAFFMNDTKIFSTGGGVSRFINVDKQDVVNISNSTFTTGTYSIYTSANTGNANWFYNAEYSVTNAAANYDGTQAYIATPARFSVLGSSVFNGGVYAQNKNFLYNPTLRAVEIRDKWTLLGSGKISSANGYTNAATKRLEFLDEILDGVTLTKELLSQVYHTAGTTIGYDFNSYANGSSVPSITGINYTIAAPGTTSFTIAKSYNAALAMTSSNNSGTYYGFHANNSRTGSATLTKYVGLRIDNMTFATTAYGIESYLPVYVDGSSSGKTIISFGTQTGSKTDSVKTRSTITGEERQVSFADISSQAGYTATATSLSLTASHDLINVTATGQTITLPTAVGISGKKYTIKLTASGSATIATTSSQTIDGAGSYSLSAQYKFVQVVSDGANWLVSSNN